MKPDLKGLTKLADYLTTVPRKQFHMDDWWQESDCGSAGCIAGHAATLFPSRFRKESVNEFYGKSDSRQHYYVVHKKSGATAEFAFAEGFGLSTSDAEGLVYHTSVDTPKQAAKAVRALVSKLEKVEGRNR